jgi:hypothetical protein
MGVDGEGPQRIVIIYFVKAKSKVAWISAADCTSDTIFFGFLLF